MIVLIKKEKKKFYELLWNSEIYRKFYKAENSSASKTLQTLLHSISQVKKVSMEAHWNRKGYPLYTIRFYLYGKLYEFKMEDVFEVSKIRKHPGYYKTTLTKIYVKNLAIKQRL